MKLFKRLWAKLAVLWSKKTKVQLLLEFNEGVLSQKMLKLAKQIHYRKKDDAFLLIKEALETERNRQILAASRARTPEEQMRFFGRVEAFSEAVSFLSDIELYGDKLEQQKTSPKPVNLVRAYPSDTVI